ncbi:DUF5131 family protein [Streptomyces sp. NPDC048156]|uniref:DUF5131 family protein n=1 Tax=Streptomyces sp. NPDC048156 TaxID=3365502 RepID=UPI00372348F4
MGFLSCEPLLGSLDGLDLTGIHWVIAGGESGPRFRPMQQEWVTRIRDVCLQVDVAFFFKQWGGRTPKASGRHLQGRTWDQIPLGPLDRPASRCDRGRGRRRQVASDRTGPYAGPWCGASPQYYIALS